MMKKNPIENIYQAPQMEIIKDDVSAVLCDSGVNSSLEDYNYTENDLW